MGTENNNNNIFDNHASSDIIFHLDDFDGPIELLVHLARINGLDIYTLKISQITDQYLAFVDSIDTTDLDSATDFLLMAATLLEIKARALLPREEEEEVVEEDILSPEEEIRRLMIEHELFKTKAQEMKENETINRFYREPVFSDKDARVTIKGFNLEKLMEAYAKVLFNFTKEEEIIDVKKIERDEYTVARQLKFLVNELIDKKQISFFSIFDEVVTKSEIINTFLALLQLCSKQFACIIQEDADGDIMIGINSECDPEVFDYTVLAMASEEDNFDGQSDTNSWGNFVCIRQ